MYMTLRCLRMLIYVVITMGSFQAGFMTVQIVQPNRHFTNLGAHIIEDQRKRKRVSICKYGAESITYVSCKNGRPTFYFYVILVLYCSALSCTPRLI